MLRRATFLLAVLFILPFELFGQGLTSASISGVVKDPNGETLPGANIVAVHKPSGTQYGTTTRANGHYTLKNLRVGGPYTITVSFVGYKKTSKTDVNLELGQDLTLDFTLQEGSIQLSEVTVYGQESAVMNSDRTGARTNISQKEIESTPSISRSLSDLTRLNPQVTSGYSFGGANDRYNNIMVDGATLNDVFGLGNAIPGSQAGVQSPISLDAIQEFNVDIAPFDVTNNGFTGGQVNAITKSGNNTYTGSAYYQLRNESFVGKYQFNRDGNQIASGDYPSFDEHYLGLNIGGPIIKDKLFFFVNGEFRRRSSPITTGLLGSGAANIFPMTADTLDQLKNIAMQQYNYNPGGYGPMTQAQDNNKILAKLDWNINQSNKFTFRYNHVDAVDENGISRGQSSYTFSNGQYNFNDNQDSFVAQLKTTASDRLFNEARLVYTRIRDKRNVINEPFPYVDISLPKIGTSGFADVIMGTEQYSQANRLDQDLIEISDNLTYLSGDHEFTFGTNNQIFKFDNLFVRNAFGAYEFRSIQDWRNGNPYSYAYSYLLPGGKPTAKFTGIQLGLYAQDKWSVNDYLKLTFGLRADVPILPDKPTRNPQVEQSFPGYSTTRIASGNFLWSPRFGFNWDLSQGDRTTQLRGGVGIFSGNPPFVWISNQYSNTGKDYGRVSLNDYQTNALGDGFFSPDPNNQPSPLDANSSLQGVNTTEVNLIANDFKYPQSLKFDAAIDQELPLGFMATIEGIYSKMINDVTFRNINLKQKGTTAYGRPLYGDVYLSRYGSASGAPNRVDGNNFTNVILMDNTSKGYQFSLTGELKKQFAWGLNTSLSYTYNRAQTVNNGSSSQAVSNWQYNENFDVNHPELGPSDYERRHRILGRVSYRFAYAERFATTISLLYDGRSGTPFSWIYNGDANGDSQYANDLIYVPAKESEVVMNSGNWDEFNNWIEKTPSVNKYRGTHVPRGSAREPWSHYLDLRINENITTIAGQKFEITASLFNVLNFLNKDWGIRKSVAGYNNYQAVTLLNYDNQGRPVINFDPENVADKNLYRISDLGSRWQMQIGLRYSF